MIRKVISNPIVVNLLKKTFPGFLERLARSCNLLVRARDDAWISRHALHFRSAFQFNGTIGLY
jgi:hypothetical protein